MYKDLESRGFCVVPSFLAPDELEMLVSDFNSTAPLPNANYDIRLASMTVMSRLHIKLLTLAAGVRSKTSVRTDTIYAGVYFSTFENRPFPWHQDHESYYEFQNHHDYLNCYIPVIKPDRTKSNLSVIPFDRLLERSPEVYEKLLNRGATAVNVGGGRTTFIDDDDGGTLGVVDYDINELAETPQLEASDLLLLRGDIIHKTEDKDTRRAALSVRLLNSKTVLRRARLVSGGIKKLRMMAANPAHYRKCLKIYAAIGKDEVSLGEYLKNYNLPPEGRGGRVGFVASLLFEKLRNRIFGDKARTRSSLI